MSQTLTLQLLGVSSVRDSRGPLKGPAVQRHHLALLALLATTRSRTMTRDKLMAWLWPARDTERARRSLNQAVHVLRRELGREAILTAGDDVQLNIGLVSPDVVAFDAAVAADELERAAELYAGPFLDGFFLPDAPEFEQWVSRERDRLASVYAGVLEGLARKATSESDHPRAAFWWKARVAHDAFSSGAVLQLMQSLAASGNRAAALREAEAHQRVLKEELGIEPSPGVRELAERLRLAPAPMDLVPILPPSTAPEPAGTLARPSEAPASIAARVVRGRRVAPWILAGLIVVGVSLTIWLVPRRVGSGLPSAVLPDSSVRRIADAVARELDRRRRGDAPARLPQQRTHSIAAYEAWLRGNDPAMLRSDSAARQALENFRRAVALDSGYAAAWSGVARLSLRTMVGRDGREGQAMAESAARRALALDDSLADAHASYGLVLLGRNEIADAEAHLLRAIALEPDAAAYHEWLARLHLWTGRDDVALADAQRGLASEPLSPSMNAEVARALLANGRCDEAFARLQPLTSLQPPLARVPGIMAQCHARQGRWKDAINSIRPEVERAAWGHAALGMLGYYQARAGQRREAASVLARLARLRASGNSTSWAMALVHLGLGELDEAVPWLERAMEEGSLTPLTEPMPLAPQLFDSLRHDPRIAALRERLGMGRRPDQSR